MHNKGLDSRLLSFELKFTDDREHSDRIHEFCVINYGILGKALSEYLLGADVEKNAGIYEECKDSVRNAIDDEKDETNNTVTFIDELFLSVLEHHGASNTDLVIR